MFQFLFGATKTASGVECKMAPGIFDESYDVTIDSKKTDVDWKRFSHRPSLLMCEWDPSKDLTLIGRSRSSAYNGDYRS